MKMRCICLKWGLWLLVMGIPLNVNGISFQDNQAKKIKVACVGNSVTKGYGLHSPEKDAYPSQLQMLLGENYEVRNFGHNGATLLTKGHRPYIQTQEYRDALNFKANIIIIHLGLNDTDPRNWPNYRDEFISDYMHLIESFKKGIDPIPQIYICMISPIFHWHPRFKSGTRDWFGQIQQAIEQVALNCHTGLIDLHSSLYNRPDLFKDALHPNEEGAAIIAKTVYKNMTGDFGGLKLAPIFMSHMVLQQKTPIPIWGKANAEDTIVASIHTQQKKCIANNEGNWKLTFDPVPVGGPYQLNVTAGNNQNITFDDILVGEVWVCAGQSNMEFPLKNATNASSLISEASDDNIRLLNKKGIVRTDDTAWDSVTLKRINDLNFFEGKWSASNAEEASEFSAIAYSFGKILSKTLHVPVGLIQISVGGAPIEAFIDRKTLEFDPRLIDVLYNWRHNDFFMDWCRMRAAKNLSLSQDDLQRHPFEPSYIFESGIQTIKGFPVSGVIWYQGESNAHNTEHYQHAFPALVQSWRLAFNQPEMPFYFAQLSGINRPSWPYFRNMQRQLAHSIPNTAMVVTSDLGDSLDVHPKQKLEVGKRFATIALSNHYHFNDLPDGGPEIHSVFFDNEKVILYFSHAKQLKTADDQPIRELEIAGPDCLFKPTTGEIKDNKIIIKSKEPNIKYVRYGWKPYSKGNLINEKGWPASTFQVNCPYP